jgi:hypothetical protein
MAVNTLTELLASNNEDIEGSVTVLVNYTGAFKSKQKLDG